MKGHVVKTENKISESHLAQTKINTNGIIEFIKAVPLKPNKPENFNAWMIKNVANNSDKWFNVLKENPIAGVIFTLLESVTRLNVL